MIQVRKSKTLNDDIIVISFLVILVRCDGWDEITMFVNSKEQWLKSFLELSNGILRMILCKELYNY